MAPGLSKVQRNVVKTKTLPTGADSSKGVAKSSHVTNEHASPIWALELTIDTVRRQKKRRTFELM